MNNYLRIEKLCENNYYKFIENLNHINIENSYRVFCVYLNALPVGIAKIDIKQGYPKIKIYISTKRRQGIGIGVFVVLCDYVLLKMRTNIVILHLPTDIIEHSELFFRNVLSGIINQFTNIFGQLVHNKFIYTHDILRSFLIRYYIFTKYNITIYK